MYKSNPWELYQSVKGWRKASGEISRAVTQAEAQIRRDEKKGNTEAHAYLEAWRIVDPILSKWVNYGAMDSEPLHNIDKRFWEAFHGERW